MFDYLNIQEIVFIIKFINFNGLTKLFVFIVVILYKKIKNRKYNFKYFLEAKTLKIYIY